MMYWNLQKIPIISKNSETKNVHSHNHWSSKKIFLGTKDLSSEPCKICISYTVFEENGCETTKNVDFRVKRTPHENLGYAHLQNSQNSKLTFCAMDLPFFRACHKLWPHETKNLSS